MDYCIAIAIIAIILNIIFFLMKSSRKYPTLVFYNVEWCPYCTSAKPKWKAFEEIVKYNKINGEIVKAISINPETQKMRSFKVPIEGYPTIIMFTEDKAIKFNRTITTENLLEFVKENI